MDSILSALWTILGKLIAEEIKDWLPVVASSITHLAVKLLPESLRERYTEEWRGHLEDTPGRLAKTITAAGFAFAAFKISRLGTRLFVRAIASLLLAYFLPLMMVFWLLSRISSDGLVVYRRNMIGRGGKTVTVASLSTLMTFNLELQLRLVLHQSLPMGTGKSFHMYPYHFTVNPCCLQRFLVWSGMAHLPTLVDVARGDASFGDMLALISRRWAHNG